MWRTNKKQIIRLLNKSPTISHLLKYTKVEGSLITLFFVTKMLFVSIHIHPFLTQILEAATSKQGIFSRLSSATSYLLILTLITSSHIMDLELFTIVSVMIKRLYPTSRKRQISTLSSRILTMVQEIFTIQESFSNKQFHGMKKQKNSTLKTA